MALLPPNGGIISQKFGHSALSVEPAMWRYGSTKAWWNAFSGAVFDNDCHPAIDYAIPSGTPIVASEAGTVTFAGWESNVSGYVIKVQITGRPTIYQSTHCSKLLVKVGAKVARGQQIALSGATGYVTGAHNHFAVGIIEAPASASWPMLYNPALFLPGGSLANDARIKPTSSSGTAIALNGAGINIRTAPTLSTATIFATSRSDGIYRNGVKIAPLSYHMAFAGWVNGAYVNGSDDWAKHYLAGGWRYTHRSLVHFV